MRTATKVWLIVAGALVALGMIIFGAATIAIGGDMSGFATNKYETNTCAITDEFTGIRIDAETANIRIVPSESEECSVECYEQDNMKHTVSVKNGTLEIKLTDTRKWYEYIGINLTSPRITVAIPKGEYGDIDVKVSTGEVIIDAYIPEYTFESVDVTTSTGRVMLGATVKQDVNITTTTGNIFGNGVCAKSMNLSASTGRVELNGITCEGDISVEVSTGNAKISGVDCRNFTSEGTTGKIYLGYLKAAEKIRVQRSTGDIDLEECDASELYMETSTGEVEGTLLSDKVFITDTTTGDVNVPRTTSGGKCEITTTTGDIEISIVH